MMPIILTEKIKERRNNLLKDAEQLRSDCNNGNLIDRLYFDYGWDFIDYKELFSSSRELCSFLNISESDTNYCWIS
jgi:hypothetical protein